MSKEEKKSKLVTNLGIRIFKIMFNQKKAVDNAKTLQQNLK